MFDALTIAEWSKLLRVLNDAFGECNRLAGFVNRTFSIDDKSNAAYNRVREMQDEMYEVWEAVMAASPAH